MVEKNTNSDHVHKKDLELILEVNRKAIEIQTAVADQNEEVMSLLNKILENQRQFEDSGDKITEKSTDALGIINKVKDKQEKSDEKIDKIVKQVEDTNKDIFRLQVLFVTGLLSLVMQIIQMFLKK